MLDELECAHHGVALTQNASLDHSALSSVAAKLNRYIIEKTELYLLTTIDFLLLLILIHHPLSVLIRRHFVNINTFATVRLLIRLARSVKLGQRLRN